MPFNQFVSAEGNALKAAAIAAAVVSGESNIHNDVRKLKGIQNCRKVKATYRQFSLGHHPDRGGNEADFVKLVEAHDEAMARCLPHTKQAHTTKRGNKKRKKFKKQKRKKRKKRKKRTSTEGSHLPAGALAGALVVGGLILALSPEEKQESQTKTPRMSRQRTEENYKQVTKHERRK